MSTRNQALMKEAIEKVQQVVPEDDEVRRIYGGLCHKFPVLVLSCGLCQAVAFIESKKSSSDSNRKKAHDLLEEHVESLLKLCGFEINGSLSEAIVKMDMRRYAMATRMILNGWIYYKRFAASILGVEGADTGEDR